MKLITLLLIVVSISACGPKCIKGHDEVYTIPAHEEEYTYYLHIGDMTIPQQKVRHVPEHKATKFVCDQYEAQK